MLVLSRKQGEKIMVGNATLTVLESKSGRTQIGIDAPKDIAIYREEIAPVLTRHKSLEDELAEALMLMFGSMTEADPLCPKTHQLMRVKIEHAARAQEALSKWRKGGAQ